MASSKSPSPRRGASTSVSDAGGVAARVGFDFQDHCAAAFFIEMLEGKIDEVFCEKSDDIQLVYRDETVKINEYVQVKSTDGDRKWSATELCKVKSGSANSVYSSSLLYDVGGVSRFRIVTTRRPDKNLQYLTVPLDERDLSAPNTKLAATIKKLSKKALSPLGNGAEYWVENAYWEVHGSAEEVSADNQKRLFEVISGYVGACSHANVSHAYDEILKYVYEAAKASKVRHPSQKRITKNQAQDWLNSKLEEIRAASTGMHKPFQQLVSPFLMEFHKVTEDDILRNLSGVEVGYDGVKLRIKDLVGHLEQWLPEYALKASEVASIGHTTFLHFFKRALDAVREKKIVIGDAIIGDLLLHICIRQFLHSEPIVGKSLYMGVDGQLALIPNIHVTQAQGKTQLWIGKALITADGAFDGCSTQVIQYLDELLTEAFLQQGRNMIISFSEPQYHVPNDLKSLTSPSTSIGKFAERLCIPILIAYNSAGLSAGYVDNYVEELKSEVLDHYGAIKKALSLAIAKVRVHVFLVPLESSKLLIDEFNAVIK